MKPNGQSRMDNRETLASLSTQDTGQRQTKHKKHNTTQTNKKMRNMELN
jgi:hypothetical protein